MLVKLEFTKKRGFFYKIKTEKITRNNTEFLKITTAIPKNRRQKTVITRFLSQYEGKIIYPKGFNKEGFPKEYPLFEMHCRKLMSDFLSYCKENSPDVAVISPNGRIKDKFYFDISPYVGSIFIEQRWKDTELQQKMLSHNGTPIQFGHYDSINNKNVAFLKIPDEDTFIKHL